MASPHAGEPMSVSSQELIQIGTLLTTRSADGEVLSELEQHFPRLPLARCDTAELGTELPYQAYGRFDLYLVIDADDCGQFTSDPGRATGLVIVRHKEDA